MTALGLWKFQDGVSQTTPFNDGVTQTTPLVSGQVFLASGAPASNVLVRAYVSEYRIAAAGEQTKPVEARTDAAGRFRLVDPPRGMATVEAEASEQLKAIRMKVAVVAGAQIELDPLTLQPTGTLAGKVSAPDHPDLLGTTVFIPGTRYVAMTDANGRYTLTHVPAGTYELAAMRPSFAPTVATGVDVRSGETTQAPELVLKLDAPVLTSLSQSNGGPDTEITIRGQNFGATKNTVLMVFFGATQATTVVRVSDTEIRVKVPDKALSGPVIVRSNGVESNPLSFQVIAHLKVSPYYAGLFVGESVQFQVEARDAFDHLVLTPEFRWELGSSFLGTLGSQGELKTHEAGWSEVRATSGAIRGVAAVGVTPFAVRVSGMIPDALAGSAGQIVARSEGLYFTHRVGSRIYFREDSGSQRVLVGTGEQGFSPDGTPALEAKLNLPEGLAVDELGNLFFSERGNHLIRVVPRTETRFAGRVLEAGKIYTLAGNALPGYSGDGGPAMLASFNEPAAVELGTSGGLFQGGSLLIVDRQNRRIRELDSNGTVVTLLGGGTLLADGVEARSYGGSKDFQLARDGLGNLAFSNDNQVRFYCRKPGTYFGRLMEAGRVYVVAGKEDLGFDGDGPGTSIRLSSPRGVAFDAEGNLFFCEEGTRAVRLLTTQGHVRWVAGIRLASDRLDPPTTREVVPATSLRLNPYRLAVRADGSLVVGDNMHLQFHELNRYSPWPAYSQ
jgi:hypothetical protein